MTLETKKQKINIVLRTKKLVDIANTLKGKNFEDVYFKAMNEFDINALSKIIYTLAEDENKMHSFKTSDDVYDFLDDYMTENSKTYTDVFREIAEAVNKEGFFNSKMKKEELEQKISNPLSSINMEELVKNSTQKAIDTVVTQEFQGYKA